MNQLAHIVLLLSGFSLGVFFLAAPAAAGDTSGNNTAVSTAEDAAFDLRNIAWSHLELKAKKLFFTARSTVRLRSVSAAEAASQWIVSPRGKAVAAEANVFEITIESTGFGASTNQVWFNPARADALQRSKLKPRGYRKDARFLDDGVFVLRTSPIDKSESDRPPEKWSKIQQYFYPRLVGTCAVVTEPSTLFYMVSARRNNAPLQICLFSNKRIIPVSIEAAGTEQLDVDYEETGATGSRRRNERVDALRLAVRPLSGDGDDGEVELMGLSGDVEILLDKASRVPLEVRGDTDVGSVRVKLEAVTLRARG